VRKFVKIKDRITTRASQSGAAPRTRSSNVWLSGKFTRLFYQTGRQKRHRYIFRTVLAQLPGRYFHGLGARTKLQVGLLGPPLIFRPFRVFLPTTGFSTLVARPKPPGALKIMLRNRIPVVATALFAIFICGSLFAPPANAQDNINTRGSVFLGDSLLGATRSFIIGNRSFSANFNDGFKFGFRATFDITPNISVEGAYSYSSNDLKVSDNTLNQTRVFGVHVHQFTGNALYFLSSSSARIRPFATAGIGLSRFGPTGNASSMALQPPGFLNQPTVIQAETKLAFNIGIGAEAKVADHYGVRVDARDYISGYPHFGLPENPASIGGPSFPVSGSINRLELSASFVFYFSGL
jgi:opacity protein-like surface antigen